MHGDQVHNRVRGFARRFLSGLLAVVMVLSLTWAGMPGLFVYAKQTEDGLCIHHPAHTAECGYQAPVRCGHVHGPECEKTVTRCVHVHTAECGTGAEGTGGGGQTKDGIKSVTSPNAEKPAEGGCSHVCSEESGCVKTVLNCQHVHGTDDGKTGSTDSGEPCGYVPEQPCTYVCRICTAEKLICALPDHVTADNAEQVRKQLEEILVLYQEMTEEEQEQADLSRCQELQAELDVLDGQEGAHRPALIEGPVEYRSCDENGKNWETNTCENYTAVTAGTTTWNSGWYVVSGSVEIGNIVAINGDVHLILTDGCLLKTDSIILETSDRLTIYAQSDGDDMGTLTAISSTSGIAGIGGEINNTCGTIIMNGGHVTATGGGSTMGGAGIGGSRGGSGGTIIINAGIVTATGNGVNSGAGIGGGGGEKAGSGGSAGRIIINGGTVTARGNGDVGGGAGIGSGAKGSGGTVTITGGTVTAKGGNGLMSSGGAGIGGGYGGRNVSITISGGTVTAEGGTGSSSFGGGNCTFTGGTVNGTSYYTVTFQTDQADAEIPAQSVAAGMTITEPDPVEGYTLSGWYTDSACQNRFDFSTPITADMTLYARATESTDYVASVTIEGETKQYTTLPAAWSTLNGNTGTIRLLKNVTLTSMLTVSSGMDVTVEMEDNVTLTFKGNGKDCFKVEGGGTLRLAGGTIVKETTGNSLVYAPGGTLYITGGTYRSKGNGLWIDGGVAIRLSGGTIQADGNPVRYGGKNVRDTLDRTQEDAYFAFYKDNNLVTDGLTKETLPSGTYTVKPCEHKLEWRQNGNDEHYRFCDACGKEENRGSHNLNDGVCTICGVSCAAVVEINGSSAKYYILLEDAWSALAGKTGTLRLLKDITAEKTLTVGSSMNVTVEMKEGVTYTNTKADCFQVRGGTLILSGGKVKENDAGKSVVYVATGTLHVSGGTYESAGNGLWIDSGAAVQVSGGTIQADKTAIRLASVEKIRISGGTIQAGQTALKCESGTVKDVLDRTQQAGEGGKYFAFYYDVNGQRQLFTTGLTGKELPSGKYVVAECTHDWESKQDNDTHYEGCIACGKERNRAPHTFVDDKCTGCGAVHAVSVEINGTVTYYTFLKDAWDAAQGQTAVLRMLKDQSLTDSIMVMDNVATDLTVEAEDGVTIHSNAGFFEIKAGNLRLNGGIFVSSGKAASGIYITGGNVVMTGGSITMRGDGRTRSIYINNSDAKFSMSGGTLHSINFSGTTLRVGSGTVSLTGGILSSESGETIVIEEDGKNIGNLLGADHAYYKDGSPVIKNLSNRYLSSGSYTVKECRHTDKDVLEYIQSAGMQHQLHCRVCNHKDAPEACSYIWTGQNASATCICGSVLTITLENTDGLIYSGSACEPAVTVIYRAKDGKEQVLSAGTDYTVDYENNINAGTDTASAVITGTTWTGTCTLPFSIQQAVPDIGTVTAEIPDNTLRAEDVRLNRTNSTPAGTLELADDTVLTYGSNICTWKFTPTGNDASNYHTITGTVEVVAKDTLAPTAQYQTGTDGWKAFVNTISFGLFCKDYKTVTISASDDTETVQGSGVAETLYYISDQAISDTDTILSWTSYTNPVSLNAQGTCFIYVKVTDQAGNTAILNSEGIVIYAESTVNPAELSYVYGQNQDCVAELDMNGNTFLKLTDADGTAIDPAYYQTDGSGMVTLKAAYLETLGAGTHTYKIFMNPQGVETDQVTLVYPFTVTIETIKLTVVQAAAADRDYDGTDTVEITAVTLDGIVAGKDVKVDLTGLRGVVSSANAGTYHSVTLPELTLSGKDKEKYTLIQPAEAVASEVTIRPLRGEIQIGTASYDKTFGDGVFLLSDITANHQEAEIGFAVTEGDDVVSVSDRSVTILNAGTAEITVSLPATTNYLAAEEKTVTVNVAQQSGYTVPGLSRTYPYVAENADSIDLAKILPADCGAVTYGMPAVTGNVTYGTAPAVDNGIVSYTVNSGTIGDQGDITIVATTQNYGDITVTVHVELTDRIAVSLKSGTEVTLANDTITYGDALSKLIFNEAAFVGADGNPVTGTLSWKDGTAVPSVGTAGAVWVFTPADPRYAGTEGTVTITVNKAVPVISVMPSVEERIYSPVRYLENDDLTGGVTDVPGVWSWQSAAVVPVVDNGGYTAVFTPEDAANYETVTEMIPVTVTKAMPYIAKLPDADEITYGDTLDLSVLSGGTVRYGDGNGQAGSESDSMETVAGTFVWKTSAVKPTVADSGVTPYTVVFMPDDLVNYDSVETTLTVAVKKARYAPDMPGSMMHVPNSCKMIKDVTLPENWEWQETERDTALEVGAAVNAVAVYVGADQGNYETETVTATLIRSSCEHKAGEILYTGAGERAPSCTEDGLGHRECTVCGEVTESGVVVKAPGHAYMEKITTEPTADREGVKTYTCSRCGHSYTEPVEKLPDTGNGETGTTKPEQPGTTGSEQPGTAKPEQPGTTEPEQPGTTKPEQPGTAQPEQPGVTKPEPEQPGITQPEPEKPGTVQPGTADTKSPGTTGTKQPENSGTQEGRPDSGHPFIKGKNGKEGWAVIRDEADKTEAGGTVAINMNGSKVVPGDVLNDIKGRDITFLFEMGNGVIWRVNGRSVTALRIGDTDLSAELGGNAIPAELISRVAGEGYGIRLHLAHEGEFGFTAVLRIDVGKMNADFAASLYYHNKASGSLELVSTAMVAEDGTVELAFTHASDYVIVIDKEPADGSSSAGTPSKATGNGSETPHTGDGWRPWLLLMIGALVLMLCDGIYIVAGRKKGREEFMQ